MKFVIEHLSKSFEKKEVLRDIDFTFDEGKIYGLLGRNGAGKTTLFNCLNRDLKADSGNFYIEDENGVRREVAAEDIGYVLSTPTVPEFLTGREFLKFFILIAVLLSLCLAFAVTGCSGDNLKDSVINGFNDMLQHFSKYALTDEKDLQGDKTKGEDTYTGSYTADYEDFNDKEYIFGGTALERDKGSELTVTYELTVDSGTAKLYWLDKGEEKMIADTSKNGTYSVTLDEGDNYLTLEGNDFCGSLQVVVE